MKALDEIKDEYAKENLFNGWDEFEKYGISETDLNQIAQRYAQQRVNEVLDNAAQTVQNLAYNSRHFTPYEAISDCKESILKLKQ